VGGNRAAASANGIRVKRHDLIVYGLAGAVAALAGIMGAARFSSADPAAGGSALTFQVVTAVIIGGTSLFGGIGSIGGSALGALLFATINNGLAVINVNSLWQNIFVGVILVFAVAVDQARRGRQFVARR
jgi:ribose transport system permease protein